MLSLLHGRTWPFYRDQSLTPSSPTLMTASASGRLGSRINLATLTSLALPQVQAVGGRMTDDVASMGRVVPEEASGLADTWLVTRSPRCSGRRTGGGHACAC